MADYGIDISRWNVIDDWPAVRRNNITFASVKVTQGDYNTSPAVGTQTTGARNAGLAVGGYHFADENVSVAANVSRFVNTGKQHAVFNKGCLAPMLDVENSPSDNIYWTAASANSFIPNFIRQLRDATSVAPVLIYASQSVFRDMLRPNEWADENVFLWVALYNGNPGNLGGYSHPRAAVHQHTSRGNVPGVRGFVDRNITLNSYGLQNLLIGNTLPPTPTPQPDVPPTPTPGGWVDYIIRSGDTLSGIAQARGTSAAELARVNSIANPNLIYPGQVIRVPAQAGGTPPTTGHYRVQPGETLSEIASRFNTTVQAIAAANHIANPDLIYAGQWLDIPSGGAPAPQPPPHRTYTVKPGDNLTVIARRLGTSVAHLIAVNGIKDANRIYPNQVLRY